MATVFCFWMESERKAVGNMTNFGLDNFYILMNIPDNSKFEQMIKNRPSASLIPGVNKRLLAQRLARTGFAVTIVGLTGFILV